MTLQARAPFEEATLLQLDLPNNPFYTEKHHRLRKFIRNYVDTEITPNAPEWEAAGKVPEEVRIRHCQLGFIVTYFPEIDPSEAGGIRLPGGIANHEWDTWCSVIVSDELNRVGWCGPMWALGGGNMIACPPIARFGTLEQKRKWLPPAARGEIQLCLGITEPDGGSDVANLRTTAVRKGNKYIVNGGKKWITNAIWADYCNTAVRTGGPGRTGISLLMIPLNSPGVKRHKILNSGVNASGKASCSQLSLATGKCI